MIFSVHGYLRATGGLLVGSIAIVKNWGYTSWVRIPMKSPPNPMQSGMHSGANRQSEKSERSDAGILFIT
jgi:hypothetical protein